MQENSGKTKYFIEIEMTNICMERGQNVTLLCQRALKGSIFNTPALSIEAEMS